MKAKISPLSDKPATFSRKNLIKISFRYNFLNEQRIGSVESPVSVLTVIPTLGPSEALNKEILSQRAGFADPQAIQTSEGKTM